MTVSVTTAADTAADSAAETGEFTAADTPVTAADITADTVTDADKIDLIWGKCLAKRTGGGAGDRKVCRYGQTAVYDIS